MSPNQIANHLKAFAGRRKFPFYGQNFYIFRRFVDLFLSFAFYARLSRDDGDKPESDSIANQRKLLERFFAGQAQMELVDRRQRHR